MYYNRYFVVQNNQKAIKYYPLAAEAGDPDTINKVQRFEIKESVDYLLKRKKSN